MDLLITEWSRVREHASDLGVKDQLLQKKSARVVSRAPCRVREGRKRSR